MWSCPSTSISSLGADRTQLVGVSTDMAGDGRSTHEVVHPAVRFAVPAAVPKNLRPRQSGQGGAVVPDSPLPEQQTAQMMIRRLVLHPGLDEGRVRMRTGGCAGGTATPCRRLTCASTPLRHRGALLRQTGYRLERLPRPSDLLRRTAPRTGGPRGHGTLDRAERRDDPDHPCRPRQAGVAAGQACRGQLLLHRGAHRAGRPGVRDHRARPGSPGQLPPGRSRFGFRQVGLSRRLGPPAGHLPQGAVSRE